MYCISVPNEALAVSIGGVEDAFELFDALFGTTEAENAFDTGSWREKLAGKVTGGEKLAIRTFFFQKHATFGNDNGHIAINVALALFIDQGDGDVCIGYTLSQRDTKDAWSSSLCGAVSKGATRARIQKMRQRARASTQERVFCHQN